jgi:hypothetical protein
MQRAIERIVCRRRSSAARRLLVLITVLLIGAAVAGAANADPSLLITTPTLAGADTGVSYSQTLNATGGSGTGYSWAVTAGQVPAGLTLSASGLLSGQPTSAGSFGFTVTLTDSDSNTASQAYTVFVANPPGLSPSLSSAEVNVPYSSNTTNGTGTPPDVYSLISGSLPTGITLNTSTGALSGTPTTPRGRRTSHSASLTT